MGSIFFLLVVLLVVGVIKHQEWYSPKGEGYVTTLVKIPHNKVIKGKLITKVMGNVFQAECWEKHRSLGVHLVYYG